MDISNDRVIVQIDCGNYSLLSEITKESHLDLQLATEDEIYCLIKTSSFK
jgi:ABC-type molybdate transport system ATPase subunit